MFRVLIQMGKIWVSATEAIPRAQARRIARAYRQGVVSPYVTNAKVVKISA